MNIIVIGEEHKLLPTNFSNFTLRSFIDPVEEFIIILILCSFLVILQQCSDCRNCKRRAYKVVKEMIIAVKVKTNAKEQSVEKKDNVYVVRLKNKPVKGRANKELLEILEKFFKKKVRIISGFNASVKRVELL